MPVGEREDPYLGFRFQVEIDYVRVAGFSEVTGLEVEVETEEYEEGGVNGYVHQLPTRFTYPNLVLERGLTDSRRLWDWIKEVVYGEANRDEFRKTVTVVLLDPTGQEETWRWTFLEALPVRWSGPEFQADQGSVAIEALELAHHGLVSPEGQSV